MQTPRFWLLLAALLAAWLADGLAETNAPPQRVISVTGQFTAFAPGNLLPNALCVFAERIKRGWRDRLDIATDDWRDPIILVVRERDAAHTNAPAVGFGVFQIGAILKYEIACYIPPPLDETAVAAAIVEALCLESANRQRSPGTATEALVASMPVWLTQGLAQSIQGQPEWLVAVARRSANSARPQGFVEIVTAASLPADAVARDIYVANAWLLVDSLRRLPNGARKLQQLLAELRRSQQPPADVMRDIYRNDFPDDRTAEKWWSLQQTRLNIVVVPQNFSARETARRLDLWLQFADGISFNDLEKYSEQPWLKDLLQQRIPELEGLRGRAHPLYRPALEAYQEAAQLLAMEKINRYRTAVRRADQLRAAVDRQMDEIQDVLDRVERAAENAAQSTALQGYFRTLDQMKDFEQHRHNPISDYLDKFEK